MVGNGVTNWNYDTTPAFIEMAYWHSLFDQRVYDKMHELKCDYSGIEFGNLPSEDCLALLQKFSDAVEKINVYDIFGTCWGLGDTQEKTYSANDIGIKAIAGKLHTYKKVFTAAQYTPWVSLLKGKKNSSESTTKDSSNELPPCIYGQPVTDYLNRQDVKDALHIPSDVGTWEMCKDEDNFSYHTLPAGSQWVWESL